MALTAAEQARLRAFVLSTSCIEFRNDQPCIQRRGSTMVGDMHKGCAEVADMLDLVDKL